MRNGRSSNNIHNCGKLLIEFSLYACFWKECIFIGLSSPEKGKNKDGLMQRGSLETVTEGRGIGMMAHA